MSPTSYQTAPPRSTGREDIGESGKIQGRHNVPLEAHFPRGERPLAAPANRGPGDHGPCRAVRLYARTIDAGPRRIRSPWTVWAIRVSSIPQLRAIGPSFTFLLPRDVAQPGSAPEWGSGGRRFESGRPDCARNWGVRNDGRGGEGPARSFPPTASWLDPLPRSLSKGQWRRLATCPSLARAQVARSRAASREPVARVLAPPVGPRVGGSIEYAPLEGERMVGVITIFPGWRSKSPMDSRCRRRGGQRGNEASRTGGRTDGRRAMARRSIRLGEPFPGPER